MLLLGAFRAAADPEPDSHWPQLLGAQYTYVLQHQDALHAPYSGRLSLHPDGMAPRIANLAEWRAHLLTRLHRQVAATADARLAALHEELRGYPGGESEPPQVYAHQIAFNALPHAGSFEPGDDHTDEERKLINETRKILGDEAIRVSATCVRVPVVTGHSEAVNVETREPADTETKQIARFCYEHGLITITAGTFNNVIRILVPLVVTDEQFDEGLGVIEAALASVAEQKQAALSHA